MINLGNVLGVA